MYTRILILVLFVLSILGCATRLQRTGMAEGIRPGPEIGVTVDENLRVVGIELKSAAEEAGVQIGDTLVSVTWTRTGVPTVIPSSEDVIVSPDTATPIVEGEVITEEMAIAIPPPTVELKIETETVPFTDGIR